MVTPSVKRRYKQNQLEAAEVKQGNLGNDSGPAASAHGRVLRPRKGPASDNGKIARSATKASIPRKQEKRDTKASNPGHGSGLKIRIPTLNALRSENIRQGMSDN